MLHCAAWARALRRRRLRECTAPRETLPSANRTRRCSLGAGLSTTAPQRLVAPWGGCRPSCAMLLSVVNLPKLRQSFVDAYNFPTDTPEATPFLDALMVEFLPVFGTANETISANTRVRANPPHCCRAPGRRSAACHPLVSPGRRAASSAGQGDDDDDWDADDDDDEEDGESESGRQTRRGASH